MDIFIEPFSTESDVSEEVRSKKFGIRAVAFAIDLVGIYALNALAGYVFGIIFFTLLAIMLALLGSDYYLEESDSRGLSTLVGLILNILYFTLFEWLYGASPGKLALRMRVVSRDGTACGLRQAVTRAAYRLIDGILFGWVAYRTMKPPLYQRYGDKSAHTIVVGARDPFVQQAPSWWKFLLAAVMFLILTGLIQILWLLPDLRLF